jgi:hypothetical protein
MLPDAVPFNSLHVDHDIKQASMLLNVQCEAVHLRPQHESTIIVLLRQPDLFAKCMPCLTDVFEEGRQAGIGSNSSMLYI